MGTWGGREGGRKLKSEGPRERGSGRACGSRERGSERARREGERGIRDAGEGGGKGWGKERG